MPPSLPTDEDTLFSAISTGINFDKYDAFPVEVSDPQFRMPFTSFEAMGLGNPPAADLAARQVRQAVPVQKHAVKIALTGRDLMACAPTGSGKTAAFMLPLLHLLLSDCCFGNPAYQPVQTPMAVILSPTRELAIQTAQDGRDTTSVQHQLAVLPRGCHILVATTGRLKDLRELYNL
ncbi:putative ATP-dependent RNA helicase DDX4 [Rhipicephalus microplus]|uniref:putative ATP-dependent RNA helicase DDX4 n=1 Tax=Rhipicephalus microplus TaxID=6941 RepID=UPI003F6D1E00